MMTHIDPVAFRSKFPDLVSSIHLSGCSLGPRSEALNGAMEQMMETMSSSCNPWHDFEEQVSKAREKFAALIGAEPGQIGLMPNASTGAYQVASTMTWNEKPQIVTCAAEFPSISHVWLAQRPRGAAVISASDPNLESYERCIDDTAGLVSVPMASYSESWRLPVAKIAELAHRHGAKVFVDAYQSVGVEPVDVGELDCDYLVAGTNKYLLGLPGVAFIYVRCPRETDQVPQLTGWFGRCEPFAFDNNKLDFPETAQRYETGTPPIPALYAANAGLDLILDLDQNAVRSHICDLALFACDLLVDQGETIAGPADPKHRGAHVAITDSAPEKMQNYLASEKISISPRGNVARLAFHYYNTREDVVRACDKIRDYRAGEAGMSSSQVRGVNSDSGCKAGTSRGRTTEDVVSKLKKWQTIRNAEKFPFDDVIEAYHRRGKHFVKEPVLTALERIRSESRQFCGNFAARRQLKLFLDTALDKFDDKYEYTTYCALSLLPLPTNNRRIVRDHDIAGHRDRQLTNLVSELLQFELDILDGKQSYLPDVLPDRALLCKRIKLGLKSMKPMILRMGLGVDANAKEATKEARKFCTLVAEGQNPLEKQTLSLTMQPVYTVHDEHMFLRILQSFETNFSWMAVVLKRAIRAFDISPETVASEIRQANTMYMEATRLFPVLGTMQREAFNVFRDYTEGASAIQSRNYKLVESLCRAPDPERRDSLAYESVPEVRRKILAGQHNLDAAFKEARRKQALSRETLAEVESAMSAFSTSLQRWRQTHYRLAVKMLGDQRGTGNTEGTPYLRAVRKVPVFHTITEGAA